MIRCVTNLALTPDELLTTTRAVRKRLDLERPVSLDLVKECIEIALQAPSGGNRQLWHWIVVTDEAKRAAIGEYYRRATEGYLASPSAPGKQFPEDPERNASLRRIGDSVRYLGENLGRVPVLVLPCIRASSLDAVNQSGLWGSILPAAWSYMLAARARGLGTAWTTLHQTYQREIGELLGLPEDIRQAVLIPTAHTIGTTFKAGQRQPVEEVLHLDGW
ncbi:nitroreductase family protein [Actinosynnema sp. NPDC020468]|uniref:nitroreductase family protein n=1 Tax=Actinosynnema sp. NPDC020468 TaxID=3154488 RepID=UPI0033EC098A